MVKLYVTTYDEDGFASEHPQYVGEFDSVEAAQFYADEKLDADEEDVFITK